MIPLYMIGQKVSCDFLRGQIVEIYEGKERGWSDHFFYLVRVTWPRKAERKFHTVREDEITKGK